MIYRLLKSLFSISIRFFFKKSSVLNAERIPAKGPLIFVANHPGTFLDPIVIAASVNRKIHFIAKGEAFRSKFAQWILPKFNMIPIYRKEHDPHLAHKNEEVFNKVYDLLDRGECILIFPEGISLEGRILNKIKTGAARMALGAESRRNFELNIKIVPLGLNFTNPYKFQETLLVRVDEPISIADYKEEYAQDSFKAAHKISEEIKTRIENLVVLMKNEAADELVKNIEIVYRAQVLKDLGYSKNIPEHVFEASKLISDRVHYFQEKEPERVQKFQNLISAYFRLLNNLQLEDYVVERSKRKIPVWSVVLSMMFYLIIGFPLFLFGLINNYLPFRIPYYVAILTKIRIEFLGAISLVLGTFSFLIFYSLQIYLAYYFSQDWRITIAYAVLLPVSGLFAYYYAKRVAFMRGKWHWFSIFMRRSNLAAEIIKQRANLIQELEKGKNDFEKAKATV